MKLDEAELYLLASPFDETTLPDKGELGATGLSRIRVLPIMAL